MRVIVALFFVLAIATAFAPLKFSPALTKAIKGKDHAMSERYKTKRMQFSTRLPPRLPPAVITIIYVYERSLVTL
jgi:hypothetical protein